MTREELAAWKAVTASSCSRWCVDLTTLLNRGELLVYTGGEDGVYVRIGATGTATTGVYSGAYPHIGEALFREQYSRTFPSRDAAVAEISVRLGGTAIGAGFARVVADALVRARAELARAA